MGTSHEDQYTFLIISRSVLLGMRNGSEKCCRENKNKHFIFSNIFFFRKSCRLWINVEKNIVQPDMQQITVWRMRIACWIPKTTNIHSEYVALIAFELQQRLHERTSLLCYTYFVCLVLSDGSLNSYFRDSCSNTCAFSCKTSVIFVLL